MKTTKKDIKKLKKLKANSHKWQNGSILVIGGSHRYHGAPLLALKVAARFVDIVHFASPADHKLLMPKLRKQLSEFIPVFAPELHDYITHVDVVLIGPGLEVNKKNTSLINTLIKKFPEKKFVLDAGAIRMVNLTLLHKQHIVSPNKKEFLEVFKVMRTRTTTKKIAKRYGATILAKSNITYIATPTQYAENHTGNAGLTKGGTGDILAGLVAAFFTKNDAFTSAKAASFLLGVTADELARKRSYAYSATDILDHIPLVFGKLTKS